MLLEREIQWANIFLEAVDVKPEARKVQLEEPLVPCLYFRL